MGDINLSAAQLRDLIVNFYTINDPHRLEDGIDVNGMVNWTVENGLVKLNQMLKEKYGTFIDPKQRSNLNSTEAINRMSRAVTGNKALEAMKPALPELDPVIAEKVNAFYKKLEPSKVGKLTKVIQFAMYKGEAALNEKLMDKYGVDLDNFDAPPSDSDSDASEDIPVVPVVNIQKKKSSVAIVKKKSSEVQKQPSIISSAAAKSEPEIKNVEPAVATWPAAEIESELQKFYQAHDPDKIVVLEALTAWAAMIGRVEFNKKMVQLYGSGLDDPLPDPAQVLQVSMKGTKVSPTRTKSEKTQKSVVQELDKQEAIAEDTTAAIETKKEPAPAKNKVPNPRFNPASIANHAGEKPSFVSFEQTLEKSTKKADPLKGPKLIKNVGKKDGACDSYKLDMTSNFFGVCKCGFPKTSHKMW